MVTEIRKGARESRTCFHKKPALEIMSLLLCYDINPFMRVQPNQLSLDLTS
jgi:hypothetical protein